jgi:hypothetical protein
MVKTKSSSKVSARKYARMRGISHVMVLKEIAQGRIPTQAGLIDVEAADEALEQHNSTLAVALRRKENAKAGLLELQLAQKQGEVVPIAAVRAKQEQINSIIRSRLLAMPGKLAPILLGMGSAARIKAALEGEIFETLAELAGRADGGRR